MFSAEIVWRGIVYTILMLLAKLVTGVWLLRLNISLLKVYIPKSLRSTIFAPVSCFNWVYRMPKKKEANDIASAVDAHELKSREGKGINKDASEVAPRPPTGADSMIATLSPPPDSIATPSPVSKPNKPLSLYPAAMLGTAMTARGEIGFLIASLAETTGLFASSSRPSTGSSEIYLVVTWAIVLCTIIGPLSMGTLVKRVRRLQSERQKTPGVSDPLGIWGVS
jgi:hypothetical protein